MELIIDTSNNKQISVGLIGNKIHDVVKITPENRRAQFVLPLIEDLLVKHKKTLRDVTAIQVNTGPGSFTGLRVGIAIANTLGYLLQIPINGKKIGEFAEAIYS